MPRLSYQDILALRSCKNRLNNGKRLISEDDAAQFIDERGIALLGPVHNLPLPSLSEADANPPAIGFEISQRAWEWKEKLPGKKVCTYGKFLRSRGTFLSWPLFAAYYQVHRSEDTVDFEEAYAGGHLSRRQREIAEIIRDQGPISSRDLWLSLRHRYQGERPHFVKDLEALQKLLLIAVCGGITDGWSCHHWDLMERYLPVDIRENPPTVDASRKLLLQAFMKNTIACLPREAYSILRFAPIVIEDIITDLPITEIRFPDRPGLHWLWEGEI